MTIPPGVEDGKRVSIPGQGDTGPNGGPPGDLYVFIHVRGHEYFERDGADLYCAMPISLTMAALGGEVSFATIEGKTIKVNVPAGVQNGKMLRVREEGVPVPGGRRGDLYLKILVQVPQKLTKRGTRAPRAAPRGRGRGIRAQAGQAERAQELGQAGTDRLAGNARAGSEQGLRADPDQHKASDEGGPALEARAHPLAELDPRHAQGEGHDSYDRCRDRVWACS